MEDDDYEGIPAEWRVENALFEIDDLLRSVKMGWTTPDLEEILERLKKELEA